MRNGRARRAHELRIGTPKSAARPAAETLNNTASNPTFVARSRGNAGGRQGPVVARMPRAPSRGVHRQATHRTLTPTPCPGPGRSHPILDHLSPWRPDGRIALAALCRWTRHPAARDGRGAAAYAPTEAVACPVASPAPLRGHPTDRLSPRRGGPQAPPVTYVHN